MVHLNSQATPAEINNVKKGDRVKMDGYEGTVQLIEETKEGNRVKRKFHIMYTEWFSGLKKVHIGYIG